MRIQGLYHFSAVASCPLARLYMNLLSHFSWDLGTDGLCLPKVTLVLSSERAQWAMAASGNPWRALILVECCYTFSSTPVCPHGGQTNNSESLISQWVVPKVGPLRTVQIVTGLVSGVTVPHAALPLSLLAPLPSPLTSYMGSVLVSQQPAIPVWAAPLSQASTRVGVVPSGTLFGLNIDLVSRGGSKPKKT